MRLLIFALFAVSSPLGVAVAAPPKVAEQPLEEARGLSSRDPAQIRESLETLGMLGSAQAAEAIAARLEAGLDHDLTLVALDALSILQQKQTARAVAPLTRHRNPEIRLRALQTLTSLETMEATAALERGLDDLRPEIRVESAKALRKLGKKSSVAVLFRALDAGQFEAAASIAALSSEPEARRLASYIGRIPFSALTEALRTVLSRADLDRRLRLDVIGQLVELATPEVKYFLEDVQADIPGPANDPVKRAASDAAFRIVD